MKINVAVIASLACQVLPCFAQAPYPAIRVKVITYNIHHGEGLDGKVDLDRIAEVVRVARPDIVCLQEVDRNLPRTGQADMPGLLAEKLKMNVVFEPNLEFDGGEYGNCTLTRFEVMSHENIRLPGIEGAEPRGCLRTTIRVGDQLLDVLNTHFGLDKAERKEQAAAILRHVRDVPTILAGDLNEDVRGSSVQALLGRFEDTDRKNAGSERMTHPAGAPKAKIDFILVSGVRRVLSARVVAGTVPAVASDHLPFVAELDVASPSDRTSSDRTSAEGIYDNDDERVTEAVEEGT